MVKPIEVSSEVEEISILEHAQMFMDENGKLNYEEVIHSEKFKPVGTDFLNLGYLEERVVWLKFELKNTSSKTLERKLHIDSPMLDVITLYDEDKTPKVTGVLHYPPL